MIMQSMKTLQEVSNIFENDRFATENGAVMGGTYFMLADFAFAVAANWEKMVKPQLAIVWM